MNQGYKISFCTVVRNRLNHLRNTLPKNIEDNLDFQNAQFVILDYNSNDGLGNWIRSELLDFIRSGKLIYYYTPEPEYFARSHSRNMVMKLSDSDIICNVDADNYIGKGFAEYINSEFTNNNRIFLSAYNKNVISMPRDVLGRICCKKEDFLLIEGFDENMNGYGFEDYDFINRLKLAGLENKIISDFNFLNAIPHSNQERINEEKISKIFHKLFISHINFSKTDVIILFKTGKFNSGRLIDYKTLYSTNLNEQQRYSHLEYEFGLEKIDWETGIWKKTKNYLQLSFSTKKIIRFKVDHNSIRLAEKKYTEIFDNNLITDFLLFHSEFDNRVHLKKKPKVHALNAIKAVYGRGYVYCNFEKKKIFVI